LKQCSRCHRTNCGCGRSAARCGINILPLALMTDRMLSASFACRETMIRMSSSSPIRPRSNIQCAVPESAKPLLTISGPFASTGRM